MKLFLLLLLSSCWCKQDLQSEWYRLVDWRENMVYISQESTDSTIKANAIKAADKLNERINEIEYLIHEQ